METRRGKLCRSANQLAVIASVTFLAACSTTPAVEETVQTSVSAPQNSNIKLIQVDTSLACIRRATLKTLIGGAGDHAREYNSELRAGTCIELPRGTLVEIVQTEFFELKVRVNTMDGEWWIFFTDVQTEAEKKKMNRGLAEIMESAEDAKHKEDMKKLIAKQKH